MCYTYTLNRVIKEMNTCQGSTNNNIEQSCYIMSYHDMLCNVMLYHIIPYHITVLLLLSIIL